LVGDYPPTLQRRAVVDSQGAITARCFKMRGILVNTYRSVNHPRHSTLVSAAGVTADATTAVDVSVIVSLVSVSEHDPPHPLARRQVARRVRPDVNLTSDGWFWGPV
jgi:hypothetical protein